MRIGGAPDPTRGVRSLDPRRARWHARRALAKLRRASFADANPKSHDAQYSRYHKSKYICSTCHDVSNPVLNNLGHAGTGTNILPTEVMSASSFFAKVLSHGTGPAGGG